MLVRIQRSQHSRPWPRSEAPSCQGGRRGCDFRRPLAPVVQQPERAVDNRQTSVRLGPGAPTLVAEGKEDEPPGRDPGVSGCKSRRSPFFALILPWILCRSFEGQAPSISICEEPSVAPQNLIDRGRHSAKGGNACVVQWQDTGLISRTRWFDSIRRHSLRRKRLATRTINRCAAFSHPHSALSRGGVADRCPLRASKADGCWLTASEAEG